MVSGLERILCTQYRRQVGGGYRVVGQQLHSDPGHLRSWDVTGWTTVNVTDDSTRRVISATRLSSRHADCRVLVFVCVSSTLVLIV